MNITLFIIILTSLTSFIAFRDENVFNKLKFNAYMIKHRKEWHRFVSYSLLHADWGHLLVNMFVLYSFGSNVEAIFDIIFPGKAPLYYIMLYVGGVAFSTLYSFGKHRNNHYYNAVGASGAVSAVLFSSIILMPKGTVILLFFPVPIPAYIFGVLYLVYSAYMAKRATDNIGHDAHFWGAVFGVAFTLILEPQLFYYFIDSIIN